MGLFCRVTSFNEILDFKVENILMFKALILHKEHIYELLDKFTLSLNSIFLTIHIKQKLIAKSQKLLSTPVEVMDIHLEERQLMITLKI